MAPALTWATLPLLAKIGIVAGGTKALGGIAQTAFSGEKKAQKQLDTQIENIQFPGLVEQYELSKQRYGADPTQTAMYKRMQQNIQRAGATGLAGLRGARARMGAVPDIVRRLSDASLGAEAAAEQERNRRFGQLGAAAQAKTQAELQKQYQKISAAQAKAVGASAIKRAGLTNIFGGFTDIGSSLMAGEKTS